MLFLRRRKRGEVSQLSAKGTARSRPFVITTITQRIDFVQTLAYIFKYDILSVPSTAFLYRSGGIVG
jgi:hypothetical protein